VHSQVSGVGTQLIDKTHAATLSNGMFLVADGGAFYLARIVHEDPMPSRSGPYFALATHENKVEMRYLSGSWSIKLAEGRGSAAAL
jgi:hypothetical protein